MFPRFMMPECLHRLGLLTFSAWALDGYQKVLWYEASVFDPWSRVTVLLAMTLAFACLARGMAQRWRAE